MSTVAERQMEAARSLPEPLVAEVLDFAQFLLQQAQRQGEWPRTLAESALAEFIRNPLSVDDFKPLSREEANAR